LEVCRGRAGNRVDGSSKMHDNMGKGEARRYWWQRAERKQKQWWIGRRVREKNGNSQKGHAKEPSTKNLLRSRNGRHRHQRQRNESIEQEEKKEKATEDIRSQGKKIESDRGHETWGFRRHAEESKKYERREGVGVEEVAPRTRRCKVF